MVAHYNSCQVEQRHYRTTELQGSMASCWRVHCFKVFGGEDWLKILLALGHCRAPVIDIANAIISRRIETKAGRVAATHEMTGPVLAARTQAAMANVALPGINPPGSSSGSYGKQCRDDAKQIGRKLRIVSHGFG
jgi:hypothetical protein